jgi:hypothetical protein
MSQMNKPNIAFHRLTDNFLNFKQICDELKEKCDLMGRDDSYIKLCNVIVRNSLFIVLMNIGMVFSRTLRGKKIREELNENQIIKCKEFLHQIKKIFESNNFQIILPNS